MRHANLLSFAFLLVTAAVPAPAKAQAPTQVPSDEASGRADDLTHRGNDLALRHQWAEAEVLFRQAWALKQSYDIGGNLGIATFALGKYRDAAEYLSFALARFPANGKPEHRDLLREKLAKARDEVGARTIAVSVAGAAVFVDGTRVGVSPLADDIFLDPGTHTIEAKLLGYETATQVVEVAKRSGDKVVLALHASQVTPASTGPNKAIVIAGASLGGAAVVTGAVLAIIAHAKASDATAKTATLPQPGATSPCVQQASVCVAIDNDWAVRDRLSNASLGVFIGAGTVGLATLGYALLVPKGRAATGFQVTPAVGANQAGVVLTGAW